MWVSGIKTFSGSYNCNNNYNYNNNNYTNNNKKKVGQLSLQPNFAQLIFRWPVIITLTFLMKDFRLKSPYIAAKTTTTTTPETTTTTTPEATPTLGSSSKKQKNNNKRSSSSNCNNKKSTTSFDNSNNNNPRTYNNSSKSNKVFLHYIPRDPRLRIFKRTATLNKHLEQTRRTPSELTKIEDLCNYGELIGGSDSDNYNTNKLINKQLNYQGQLCKC